MNYKQLVKSLNSYEKKGIFRYEASPNEDVITIFRMKSELLVLVKGQDTPVRFGKLKYLSDAQHALIWKMLCQPIPTWYEY